MKSKEHHVKLVCSFCGKSQRDVRKLIAGPTVYICNDCLADALCCSFCGKAQNEVQYLIAGPSVYICDECVGLCQHVITDQSTSLLRHYAQMARSLAIDVKKLSMIPAAISDRASVLAAELERQAASDKPDSA